MVGSTFGFKAVGVCVSLIDIVVGDSVGDTVGAAVGASVGTSDGAII